jgi:hypothetical protein
VSDHGIQVELSTAVPSDEHTAYAIAPAAASQPHHHQRQTRREAIRCRKRYIAREIYQRLEFGGRPSRGCNPPSRDCTQPDRAYRQTNLPASMLLRPRLRSH